MSYQNLRKNMNAIDDVRTLMTLISGVVAGILGVEGLKGAMLYLTMYAMVSAGCMLRMGFDSQQYTNMIALQFLFADFGKYALSFILFWTLTYGLVYIY